MSYTCSKDPSHQSTDSDYCSICGAKIKGAPSALPVQTGSSSTGYIDVSAAASTGTSSGADAGQICPDCGTPRRSGARFCEVCRYNFDTGASSGNAPVAATPVAADPLPTPTSIPVAPPVVSTPAAVSAAVDSGAAPDTSTPTSYSASPAVDKMPEGILTKWELLVNVDPSLYVDPDPAVPCPAGEPEHTFPVDLPDNLIGRRSDKKDIHPEVPLSDPGVSHRHAKLLRQQDGSLILLDVGSTNGTQLNGVEIQPGVRTPLQEGDQITLGCWTRITLRRS